jgi:hypothetical protein
MSSESYGKKQATSDSKLYGGLAANNKKVERIKVKGREVSVAECLNALERRALATLAVEEARGRFHEAVRAQREVVASSESAVSAMRQHLAVTLDDTALAVYGIAPKKKRAAPSVEERAAAIAKSRATRAANRWWGPKGMA